MGNGGSEVLFLRKPLYRPRYCSDFFLCYCPVVSSCGFVSASWRVFQSSPAAMVLRAYSATRLHPCEPGNLDLAFALLDYFLCQLATSPPSRHVFSFNVGSQTPDLGIAALEP